MGQSWGRVADIRPDYRNNATREAEERRIMLVTSLVCTCAGFTPGGSLRKKEALAVAARAVVRCPWSVGRLPLALRLRVGRTPDRGRPHGKTFLVSTIPSSYRVVCAKQCCSAPISAVVPPMSLVWQSHANCNSPSSVASSDPTGESSASQAPKQSRVWRKFAAPVSVTEPQCVPISCALRAGLLGAGALERGW